MYLCEQSLKYPVIVIAYRVKSIKMNDSRGGGRPKKKRSFLQKAKKFGRQGQRGKGTNIAQVSYKDFKAIKGQV